MGKSGALVNEMDMAQQVRWDMRWGVTVGMSMAEMGVAEPVRWDMGWELTSVWQGRSPTTKS